MAAAGGLRKLDGTYADPTLWREIETALPSTPDRLDWESVHSVLVVDYVTGQDDRGRHNVFFRERAGKLSAVAIDNEAAFGQGDGYGEISPLQAYVLRAAPKSVAARQRSPRLRRGLAGIDVEAWKADLAAAGIPSGEVDRAAARLEAVRARGLAAIARGLPDGR